MQPTTSKSEEDKEIRVSLSYRLPSDPLKIVSMSDYDIALLLSKNWFEYDSARKAIPGIIETWRFDDKKGEYNFKINKNAKWSDGSEITANDLLANIKRAKALKTSYGDSIDSLIEISNIKIISSNEFVVPTKNKKPSEAFFQRMGSIFLAITSPKDWDSNQNLVTNRLSSGPYFINKIHPDGTFELEKNKFYFDFNNVQPRKVLIRKSTTLVNLNEFVKAKTWENIVQITSLVNPEIVEQFKKNKLPIWTRGHDRVSLLRPLNGSNILSNIETLKAISKFKLAVKDNVLPFNSKVAWSLQPFGYPLHYEDRSNRMNSKIINNRTNVVSIVAPNSIATQFQINILEELFLKLNVKIKWSFLDKSEFIGQLTSENKYDFALFDFGVADPEAVTWCSLVFDMKFVFYRESDYSDFLKVIKNNSDNEKTVKDLKVILKKMQDNGYYLPLFHFSTLSVGFKNLSFENIKDLDETVDYSKIKFFNFVKSEW